MSLRNRFIKHLAMISLIIFILVYINYSAIFINYEESNQQEQNYCLKTSSLQNITIINDIQLEFYSNKGNGSENNPFFIQDYEFDYNNAFYSIFVRNVSKYFIIYNCSISNSKFGIIFENITTGSISYCFFYDVEVGIYLSSSQYAEIEYTIFINNINSSIYLSNSTNNILKFNTLDQTNIGISLFFSNNNEISYNRIIRSSYSGVLLNSSNYNELIGNVVKMSIFGIQLFKSNHSYLSFNDGDNNAINIAEFNCFNNTFVDNFISKNILNNAEKDDQFIYIDFTFFLFPFYIVISLILVFSYNKKEKHRIGLDDNERRI